jgi:hypothetical protein
VDDARVDDGIGTRVDARPDGATGWGVLGRHGRRLHDRETFAGWSTANAFALITGEPNMDYNICSLHGTATPDEAKALVARVDAAGVPAVVPVSGSVRVGVSEVLAAAGFVRLDPEVAMWRPAGSVESPSGPFEVRPVRTRADIAVVSAVVTAAHGTSPGVVERAFNLDALEAGDVRCYLAWDGDDPAATAWMVTGDGFASVHEMMTVPRHRRRGAGRAVLGRALTDIAPMAPAGTLLWASALGRPLYAAIGFEVFDVVTPWVRGATDDELAAIGATRAS